MIMRFMALFIAVSIACMTSASSALADPTETMLWSFAGPNGDGANPYGGLVADKSGALYGTTLAGGLHGSGTVFKLMPPAKGETQWSEEVLHSFGEPGSEDGAFPAAGLIADKTGALYGTTTGGGGHNHSGTVFKVTPPAKGETQWTENVLYSFGEFGSGDGAAPFASLTADKSGALYGTTVAGGQYGSGMLFKLTPPAKGETQWTEEALHGFGEPGSEDGTFPYAGLVVDRAGALYGTTLNGGGASNLGTVFKLTPPAKGETQWTENVLYSFTGCLGSVTCSNDPNGDGANPYAGLVVDKSGALYGTTVAGGQYGSGTVFKLTPPGRGETDWTEAVLWRQFGYGTDGGNPYAALVADKTGALYGTTTAGGATGAGYGTVFKLTPPAKRQTTWREDVLHSFQSGPDDGEQPFAGLVADKAGVLYGTTFIGGASLGTVFQLVP